jgi:hypothetical protein
MTLKMNLFSYLKKLFFMGTTHTTLIFVAKRKYWIEWECLFDKHPSEGDLKQVKKDLEQYIRNYLNELFTGKMKSKGYPVAHGVKLPDAVGKFIDGFFDGASGSGSVPSKSIGTASALEYLRYDEEKFLWEEIEATEYDKTVQANLALPVEQKRKSLRFNYFSAKWMDLLQTEWKEVSGSQSVFSFRGWFEGKNHLRLSDAGAENKGSVNPPPPPPPPAC